MVALSMDMLRSESEPILLSRILGTGSEELPNIWARTISILVTHSGLRYVGVSLYSIGWYKTKKKIKRNKKSD